MHRVSLSGALCRLESRRSGLAELAGRDAFVSKHALRAGRCAQARRSSAAAPAQAAQRKLFASLQRLSVDAAAALNRERGEPRVDDSLVHARAATHARINVLDEAGHAQLRADLDASEREVDALRQECSRLAQNAAAGQRDYIVKLGALTTAPAAGRQARLKPQGTLLPPWRRSSLSGTGDSVAVHSLPRDQR